jgi:hypothetical protein
MSARAQRLRLLPSAQYSNLVYVAVDGGFIGMMSAAASFVSVLVIRLGVSPFWVSLLSSMPSAIALVMTIPWSEFVGRQRYPQRVFAFARLAVHVVYPLVAIVPFFFQEELAGKVIVVIWSLSAFPSSLSNVMFTLVMGHAAPPERRSFLMSRRWIVMGIANLIALPLVSRLIDRMAFPTGYQLAFGINALIAMAALYCGLHIRVPEQTPAVPSTRQPLVARVRAEWRGVIQERPFLVFVGGRAMLNLGLALVSAVVPIYWINHLNASDTWVGYFNAAATGATLLAYFPWVRIKRKYGTQWTLIPSVLVTALYPALLALTRAPAAVLPFIALNGFAGAGINLAFFDALLENCPAHKEARFVAINMTAVNLMGVIGPPIGAGLIGVIGIRWVLATATVIALVGVAIFAFVRPEKRGPQTAASG